MEKEKTNDRRSLEEQTLDQVKGGAGVPRFPDGVAQCQRCGKTFNSTSGYLAHITECKG